jgi:peptide/nickel transport system ATP-binding protein
MTLRRAIGEPLAAAHTPDIPTQVDQLADLVALTADLLGRRAHEVSDGQLQRACLARALALGRVPWILWVRCDRSSRCTIVMT